MNSSKYTWLTILYPTAIKILWIENCLLLMCHYDGVWIGLWIFLTNVPINVKDVMYYVNSDSDLFAISHPNCLASWCTCYTIIKVVTDQVIWLLLNSYQLLKWYQNLIEARWNSYILFQWYGYIEILIVLGKGKFDVLFNNILIVDRCKLNMTLYSLYVVFVTVYCQNKIPIKLKFMKHTCMNKN